MPLFLRSVELNPQIQLILVSTSEVASLPSNVTQIPWTRTQIEQRARERIDPNINIVHAYKLCDLRPFYGLMFPDLIEGFDFWGYCDIDLIFGDLSRVVSNDRLSNVDMFFADAKMIMGHFALYRNVTAINTLGRRIPDYVKKISSVATEYCDEQCMADVLSASSDVRVSMARSLQESQLTVDANGQMIGRTSGVIGNPDRFYWRDGRTFIKSRGSDPQEVLYIHFLGLKRNYHWNRFDSLREYEHFSLSAAGFAPWVVAPDNRSYWQDLIQGRALRVLSSARAFLARTLPASVRLRAKEAMRELSAFRRKSRG
jgi:hypothetical protein